MLGTLAGRPAAIINFLEGMWPRKPERRPLRRRRRGAGEDASRRARFPMVARQCAVGRGLAAAVRCRRRRAPTSVQHGPARFPRAPNSIIWKRVWPKRSAARRDPRRSVSRQRVLSRRQAVRADRLPVRLQRHPRLRRRDLPQRLVLRARSFLQRHQGARVARRLWPRAQTVGGRAGRAAAAGARRGDALPADAAGRFSQRAARRAGAGRRIRWNMSASCASTRAWRACATTASSRSGLVA